MGLRRWWSAGGSLTTLVPLPQQQQLQHSRVQSKEKGKEVTAAGSSRGDLTPIQRNYELRRVILFIVDMQWINFIEDDLITRS